MAEVWAAVREDTNGCVIALKFDGLVEHVRDVASAISEMDLKLSFGHGPKKPCKHTRCAVCDTEPALGQLRMTVVGRGEYGVYYRIYDPDCWDRVREHLPEDLLAKLSG